MYSRNYGHESSNDSTQIHPTPVQNRRLGDLGVVNWSVDDVVRWLYDVQLPMYDNKFRENMINGQMLLSLENNPQVLDKLVHVDVHKKRFNKEFKRLTLRTTQRLPSPLQLPQHSPSPSSIASAASAQTFSPPLSSTSSKGISPSLSSTRSALETSGHHASPFRFSKRGRLLRRATVGEEILPAYLSQFHDPNNARVPSAPTSERPQMYSQDISCNENGSNPYLSNDLQVRPHRASSLPTAVKQLSTGNHALPHEYPPEKGDKLYSLAQYSDQYRLDHSSQMFPGSNRRNDRPTSGSAFHSKSRFFNAGDLMGDWSKATSSLSRGVFQNNSTVSSPPRDQHLKFPAIHSNNVPTSCELQSLQCTDTSHERCSQDTLEHNIQLPQDEQPREQIGNVIHWKAKSRAGRRTRSTSVDENPYREKNRYIDSRVEYPLQQPSCSSTWSFHERNTQQLHNEYAPSSNAQFGTQGHHNFENERTNRTNMTKPNNTNQTDGDECSNVNHRNTTTQGDNFGGKLEKQASENNATSNTKQWYNCSAEDLLQYHSLPEILHMPVGEFLSQILSAMFCNIGGLGSSHPGRNNIDVQNGFGAEVQSRNRMVVTCCTNLVREGYDSVGDLVSDVHLSDFRDDLRKYGMTKRFLNQVDRLLLAIRKAEELSQIQQHTRLQGSENGNKTPEYSMQSTQSNAQVATGPLNDDAPANTCSRDASNKASKIGSVSPNNLAALRCDLPVATSWSEMAAAAASALATASNSVASSWAFQTQYSDKTEGNSQHGSSIADEVGSPSECEQECCFQSTRSDKQSNNASCGIGATSDETKPEMQSKVMKVNEPVQKLMTTTFSSDVQNEQPPELSNEKAFPKLDEAYPTRQSLTQSSTRQSKNRITKNSKPTPKYKLLAPKLVQVPAGQNQGNNMDHDALAQSLGIDMQAVEDDEEIQRSYQFNDEGLFQYGNFVVGPSGMKAEDWTHSGLKLPSRRRKILFSHQREDINLLKEDEHGSLNTHYTYRNHITSIDAYARPQSASAVWQTGRKRTEVKRRLQHLPDCNSSITQDSGFGERIRILRKVGRGAGGVVFKALDIPQMKLVAVKQVLVHDASQRRQMCRELNALLSLSHPNIVRFINSFTNAKDETLSMVFDFVERGSFQDVVDSETPIPVKLLSTVTYQCLLGVRYLHQLGLVHRDIKPSNLLIRQDGRVLIADFGIARDLDSTEAKASTYLGTVMYMSPERVKGSDYSFNCDIWSLGLSIMSCALGHFPFNQDNGWWDLAQSIQVQRIPNIEHDHDQADFIHIIQEMLCRDSAQRPSACQLLETRTMKLIRKSDPSQLAHWMDGCGSRLKQSKNTTGGHSTCNNVGMTNTETAAIRSCLSNQLQSPSQQHYAEVDEVARVAKLLWLYFESHNQVSNEANAQHLSIQLKPAQKEKLDLLSSQLGVSVDQLMSSVVRMGTRELGNLSPASA